MPPERVLLRSGSISVGSRNDSNMSSQSSFISSNGQSSSSGALSFITMFPASISLESSIDSIGTQEIDFLRQTTQSTNPPTILQLSSGSDHSYLDSDQDDKGSLSSMDSHEHEDTYALSRSQKSTTKSTKSQKPTHIDQDRIPGYNSRVHKTSILTNTRTAT